MLLQGKNCIIYGAGGSIGGAIARTYAGEGPRSCSPAARETLDDVAADTSAAGGMTATTVNVTCGLVSGP
jgi:NAD(P)-dependent dehydrogenase (short-subunit alcohol dehydrogenase family)